MLFQKIIGQSEVKQRLLSSVKEQRISHAQLFVGSEGSGNLALALAYAQYINCTDKQQDDACGKCRSCLKYQKLTHPDLHFVFPVATTKKITKNPVSDNFLPEWRTLVLQSPYFSLSQWYNHIGVENKQGAIQKDESHEILRKLSLKTYEAEYKVMVIWQPEKMNDTAANKLLKIIEEPPAKTLFLLVSENSEQIIRTILSRTQLIKINKINDEDLKKALMDEQGIEEETARQAVRFAAGNYIEALNYLKSSEEDTENLAWFMQLMRLTYSRKVVEIYPLVDSIAKTGRERIKRFLVYTSRMLRENFVMNLTPEIKNQVVFLTQEEMAFSQKFSPFITSKIIFELEEELNTARFHIERNGYANLVLLDMSLKILNLFRR